MRKYDHKNNILTDLVTSPELRSFATSLKRCKEELPNWAGRKNELLINSSERVTDRYQEMRRKFNATADQADRIFIFPAVRVKEGNDRKYDTFRWLQYVNNTYLNRSRSDADWTVKELPKVGNGHYSETDLKKLLTNKNNEFMTVIIEAEHCFRFFRQQYAEINRIYRFARSLRFPDSLNDIANSRLDLEIFPTEYRTSLEKTVTHWENGIFLNDPLSVKGKPSLFNSFYDFPDEPTECF